MREAKGIKANKEVPLNDLQDGTYVGKWGGYVVTFEIEDSTYNIDVDLGIRAMNAPCIITIDDGIVKVVTRRI